MALSFTALSYASATVVTPGVAVAVSLQPPDNCARIVVFNKDFTNDLLVGQGAAGAPLVAGASASTVPPRMTLDMPIRAYPHRPMISDLACDAVDGGAVAEITYYNELGSVM
jgi:hypothetical protein